MVAAGRDSLGRMGRACSWKCRADDQPRGASSVGSCRTASELQSVKGYTSLPATTGVREWGLCAGLTYLPQRLHRGAVLSRFPPRLFRSRESCDVKTTGVRARVRSDRWMTRLAEPARNGRLPGSRHTRLGEAVTNKDICRRSSGARLLWNRAGADHRAAPRIVSPSARTEEAQAISGGERTGAM